MARPLQLSDVGAARDSNHLFSEKIHMFTRSLALAAFALLVSPLLVARLPKTRKAAQLLVARPLPMKAT
jgi:hypothetical protein